MKHIDPDAYDVYDYTSGRELEGLPTEDLVRESLSAGDTGAVCATYDADELDDRCRRQPRSARARVSEWPFCFHIRARM